MGRIFHLSDIHFGAENKAACEAALRHCHDNEPDLVLITGDITQQGFSQEFEDAARWIREMPEPVFVTVGNHDVPYWNILDRLFYPWRRFEQATGCGVLVNTSFNVRGEPVVCTPDDAYRCFMNTEMDFLILGRFVIERTAQPGKNLPRRVAPQTD